MRDSPDAAVTTPAQEHYRLPPPPSAALRAGLAVAAGAALAAAFAPLNLWPLAVLCPAMLLWLWQDATPGEAARLRVCFNCATLAPRTHLLYARIHLHRPAPLWLPPVLLPGAGLLLGPLSAAPRGGAAGAFLDPGRRGAGIGGGGTGGDTAGREVAREHPRHDARGLPDAHREGTRHAAHRVAGVRARRRRQRPRSLPQPPVQRGLHPWLGAGAGRAARARRRSRQRRAALLQLRARPRSEGELVRQASPRAVRGSLSRAALRALVDAPDEPAVFGLHACGRGPAAPARGAPADRRHGVLRGRLRQLHASGGTRRRRPGQRHQRRLVRALARPAPAP